MASHIVHPRSAKSAAVIIFASINEIEPICSPSAVGVSHV